MTPTAPRQRAPRCSSTRSAGPATATSSGRSPRSGTASTPLPTRPAATTSTSPTAGRATARRSSSGRHRQGTPTSNGSSFRCPDRTSGARACGRYSARRPSGPSDLKEGNVGVGQAGEVDLAAGADDRLDVVVDVPDVDVHAGDHRAAGEPERDELQRGAVAAGGDLVVRAGRGQGGALQAEGVP